MVNSLQKELEKEVKESQINKDIFRKFNVKLAYLFGSQAKGTAYEKSDYDVAVLFENEPSEPLALKETTFLTLELDKFFPAELEIVCLNAAPALLKYEVVAYGKPIYCRDEDERIDFEVSAVKEYIDDKYTREIYYDALYKRIEKGAF